MKRIIFMGTPEFSVPILQQLIQSEYEIVLVVTQPDRPKGRKKIITPPPVKVAAEKNNLPVFQPEKLTDDFQTIIDYQPDLIVTAAYGQLLPKELLEAPAYGCINVHASLLPELRGGAPIHYAILEGKKETGITIMYMAEKLGATLLVNTLPKLFNQDVTPLKQDEERATYAPNIQRKQERIDWTKSNDDVYNHIRGLHPWPVAFTTYEGKTMKIWWGTPVDK